MNPRPTRNDPAIIAVAAANLAPKVKEWLGNTDDPLEEIARDLEKALEYNDDGYEIARALDGNYSPDAALVEILDDAFFAKLRACAKAEIAWVAENNLQPIPLQTRVRWPQKPEAGIGVVIENDAEGKSHVRFEALGHVVSGEGRHASIIAWEKLEIVSEPVAP